MTTALTPMWIVNSQNPARQILRSRLLVNWLGILDDNALGVVVSLKVHLNPHKLSYLRGLC